MKQSPKRTVTSQQAQRNRRVFGRVLFLIITGVFVLFIARFSYIAIGKNVEHVNLSARAQKLYTATQTVKAQRGTIYDDSNQPIAEDTSTYSLYAVLDKTQRSTDGRPMYVQNKKKTATVLAKYLPISKKRALAYLTPSNAKTFQVEFGLAGQNISLTTRNKIEQAHLTGLNFVQQQARLYPNGVFASYLVGNTATNSKGVLTGTMGLESQYNSLLTGTNGFKTEKQDNNGYKIPGTTQKDKKAKNGDDVYTTLDSRLQTLLETEMSALQSKTHSRSLNAVLMNAKTGEIVASTQRPTFNPETGAGLGTDGTWRDSLVQDLYEPGSTMKVFTMAASIDSGNYNGNATYQSGKYTVGGQVVPDWQTSGWGIITYNKGFALSSNVAMAHLEQQMGAKTWMKYIKRFKFLKSTNFGLPGEQAGSIQFSKAIEQADTAFGQGIQVTAIQMLQGLSAIANNGKMLKPYLVRKVVDPNTGKTVKSYGTKVIGHPVSAATAKAVRKHMEDVVYKSYGIGGDYKIKGVRIAAKTGTAQVSNGKSGYLSGDDSYLYSVAAMAPAKNPKYIMYITMKQPTLPGTETATQLLADVFKPVMKRALLEDSSSSSTETSTKMVSYVNRSAKAAEETLTKAGYKVTVLGSGNRVVKQSPESGQVMMEGQRVILLTSGAQKMPSISGWSKSDILRLADLLGMKVTFTGNGYAKTQSIKAEQAVSDEEQLKVSLGN
ncbi:penicillin-binding transpeptidase domain-containing protein [Secundilactobacillus paracollinoides]|uniref:Penicillin-binding protein n=1 Tax=Secundilactobacillus paracollinoides TaxID=240427 RepID=A0A1B2J044_9LACO|nr:penicillin-binding transpeptidase domain-containing protein [Secundilactobacillus paracollinoides]ANZ61756.1 penicillin-binding protein [Secundilactobacillus paracollinoides]ANZ67675.1 penicillin-binding protein [Secundilactobacillus paracollinoides]